MADGSSTNPDFGEVRTLEINGEPWFVGRDVATALDITNSRNIAARLEDDEKGVTLMDTLGGAQKALREHVDGDDALKWGLTDNHQRIRNSVK